MHPDGESWIVFVSRSGDGRVQVLNPYDETIPVSVEELAAGRNRTIGISGHTTHTAPVVLRADTPDGPVSWRVDEIEQREKGEPLYSLPPERLPVTDPLYSANRGSSFAGPEVD
jgi:hypothetical protein